jgi:glycosyltransferase involved in cell wall biosynthesis
MPKQPTVSALICVRDGEAYLVEAIESALAQTPAEVIVVDDGSEDRSGEVARSYAPRVRVVEQGRLGRRSSA